jgi:hypothetical protein
VIGDLIVWTVKTFRQNTCDHNYRRREGDYGVVRWRECSKCRRTKDWHLNV